MINVAHEELLNRAKELDLPTRHHIDGRDESGSGAVFEVVSPRDGQVLTEVADAREAEVDLAVAAARRAFDLGPWPRLAPADRGRVLLRIAELLEQQRMQLALTVSLEMGKPIADAYDIELRAAINTFRWYGQLADKLTDESPHTARDTLALVTREPAGVVGAVVPWNFPLTLASWKVAPALAAGCTVVLKPSEFSPLSALLLGRIGTDAGLPPGVLNVVTGHGPTTGRAIGLHPDVDVVAFTGSTAVGRHFLRYAADSNLKRVWLELGGKAPNIVLPDAPDLEKAAATAAWGIFFNQGEMCTAPSRLLVHSSIAERVTEAIVRHAHELRVGDPLDPATEMGALVGEAHLDRVLDHIATGQEEGARLRTDGQRILTTPGGSFLQPTVFDRVAPSSRLAREEIFGPVLSVLTFDDLDEAVRLASSRPCSGTPRTPPAKIPPSRTCSTPWSATPAPAEAASPDPVEVLNAVEVPNAAEAPVPAHPAWISTSAPPRRRRWSPCRGRRPRLRCSASTGRGSPRGRRRTGRPGARAGR